MKRGSISLLIVALLALPLLVFAATSRTVVVEVFTGTWCQYCPGAARGVDDLVEEHPGKVLAIEYHGGDAFENTDGGTRQAFYGNAVVSGYPTAVFDGLEAVVGGSSTGTMFFSYNAKYVPRSQITPPLTISLSKAGSYSSATTGTLIAIIKNTSSAEVSGTVHFTMTESHIPYKWQTLDTLDYVERTMLPNASGESITLAPGEQKKLTRSFTIDPSWPSFTKDANIEFGCFVQGSSREIYQAAASSFSELPIAVEENNVPSDFSIMVPGVVSTSSPIEFSLNSASAVKLSLFDSTGRLVKTICSGRYEAGTHAVELSADGLASGVYFVSSFMNGQSELHKVVVTH